MKGKSVVLASLWFMVLLIGLTILPIARAQESLLPSPTGPYQIGTFTRHWIDDSREETHTPDDDTDKRELIVQFWYPAEVEAGENQAAYISNAEVVMPAMGSIITDEGIAAVKDFANIKSHTLANAPLAATEEAYPVLIFSPGWGFMPELYTAQLEELASHGYIVAAINHPYISGVTLFPDGRIAQIVDAIVYKVAGTVTQDQIFVLDQLEILNADDPDQVFTNRLDLNHIGIFGHSLGGGASVQTCSQDSRCSAGANEDGTTVGDAVVKGFDQPFVLFFSENENFDATGPSFRAARGPVYAIEIIGMQHIDFMDLPLWPPSILKLNPAGLGPIEPERAVQLTRTYLLAFFDQYLKGEPSELLEGASGDYPEVNIQMRNT